MDLLRNLTNKKQDKSRGANISGPERTGPESTTQEQEGKKSYEDAMRAGMRFACENTTDRDTLLTNLYSYGVISSDQVESLQKCDQTGKMMRELMLLVSKKGLTAFQHFLEALNKSGNEHIASHLKEKEEQAKADAANRKAKVSENRDNENDDNGSLDENPLPKTEKRSRKKKGKLLSVYVASDDEDDEEEESKKSRKTYVIAYQITTRSRWRLHPPDWSKMNDDNQYDFLLEYAAYLETCLMLNYYPDKVYSVHRFDLNKNDPNSTPPPYVSPKKIVAQNAKESADPGRFYKSVQKFTVSRAIFLQGVSFFGPTDMSTLGYDLQVSIGLNKRGQKLSETRQIVDAQQGDLVHVSFSQPILIRPATPYWIKFTIKATAEIRAEKVENKKRLAIYKYGDNEREERDIVQFEFDRSTLSSTCQMPTLEFYRALEQIGEEALHRPPARTFTSKVMDLFPDMTRLYHVTQTQAVNYFHESSRKSQELVKNLEAERAGAGAAQNHDHIPDNANYCNGGYQQ